MPRGNTGPSARDTPAIEPRDDGEGKCVIDRDDEQIEAVDAEDSDGLEQPRLAVERVSEKAPRGERRDVAACELHRDPRRRRREGPHRISRALLPRALAP